MAEWTLKYADARGEIHQQVAQAASERELRDRYTQQGFLVYSIRPRSEISGLASSLRPRGKKLNLEKFLIFNQQFVTLIRAGLPILKALDLLAERLTDAKLSGYIKGVREEVRNGALLSDAFARQGVFPPIYVTTVLAGERSGSLAEVIERFITYQKLSLSVRKKLLVSALLVIGIFAFRYWARTERGSELVDRFLLRIPIAGEVWLKYQVAQFSRVLGTLLIGGIPLLQALETAGDSLGTQVLKKVLRGAVKLVREGQSLSQSLRLTKVFPGLSLDMIEVGESTGALPAMLGSVAEFYEDDVATRTTAALSLIEPAIMIFMGIFVAFVLISLYLPIFSLADTIK